MSARGFSGKASGAIRLSPSALNLYRDCPRCFWLEKVRFLKRPRGIFPSLPSGMDRVIKTYFDSFRAQGTLPPELRVKEFENTTLFADQARLDLWREWRTGLEFKDEDGSVMFGALDDLMVTGDAYIPFDYKTKGSPANMEDTIRYYQNQIDCYALMLEANGMKSAGYGYFLYYSPGKVGEKGWVNFHLQAFRVDVDTRRARQTLRSAVELMRQPEAPDSAPACEYCEYLHKMNRYHSRQAAE
ncbi:MAG: PD-(D/E)XK nuclease family protein [Candidatus Omnitrophica bacterium]|nr:PD-(D/E)XK nuclease family protein [Candidatus Omnitrophota bacterium]